MKKKEEEQRVEKIISKGGGEREKDKRGKERGRNKNKAGKKRN